MKPKAVFLDLHSVDRQDLDLSVLQLLADWAFYDATTADQTLERVLGQEIIVSNKVVLDRSLMAQLPDLKLVVIAATGTNNVDLVAAKELGIEVKNITAYATASVVQHVFMLIFNLLTQFNAYQNAVKQGDWAKSDLFCLLDFPIQTLAGKKLGIIGYGELGRSVAAVAKAFGAEVLVSQRPGDNNLAKGRLPLAQILAKADIVSLHCPLAENTKNLFDAERIGQMKQGAILINTARGGLVDEPALLAALHSGHLAGAALDTLEQEPPEQNSLLLNADLPNLIVTPHIAWAAIESRQCLIDKVAENIRRYCSRATHKPM